MSQRLAVLQDFVWTLRELGYAVGLTTSANTPYSFDGRLMSEVQFHGMAHALIYPQRLAPTRADPPRR